MIRRMSSTCSALESQSLAAGPMGSTVQAEFDLATAALDNSNFLPIKESLSVTAERPLVPISATSSTVSDTSPRNKHAAIRMLYAEDGTLLAEDFCGNSGLQFWESGLGLHNQDYIERIKELQCQLDTVKKIVRPGCSEEVLNVALNSISSLVRILSMLSSKQKPHASL